MNNLTDDEKTLNRYFQAVIPNTEKSTYKKECAGLILSLKESMQNADWKRARDISLQIEGIISGRLTDKMRTFLQRRIKPIDDSFADGLTRQLDEKRFDDVYLGLAYEFIPEHKLVISDDEKNMILEFRGHLCSVMK